MNMKINGYIYVKSQKATYLYHNGTIMEAWWGYIPQRCSHGFYRYPRIEENFEFKRKGAH